MTTPDFSAIPPTTPPTNTPVPPPVQVKKRAPFSFWLVWLVPVIAVTIGLWLGVKSVLDRGPSITISFHSAEGLEAGKTKIKYKDVDIGLVKTIHLTSDHTRVEVNAEMNKSDGVDALLAADTRFWVVRPHVSAGGVTGLGTLLSGAYIGLDIGHAEETQRSFKGLEVPPIVTADLPGRSFKLKAQNLGSLGIGSPVYFRRVQVGQVVAFDLDANGKQIFFTIFVNAPYDRFVNTRSRFWHASGFDVTLSADGVRVLTESLISVVSGGISFQDLVNPGDAPLPQAASNAEFSLYDDRTQALKQPDLYGFDYQLLFQSSVRGLSVGAPVDFRGLPIGEVTSINVETVPSAKNPAPQIAVAIRVYPSRLPILKGIQSEDESVQGQRAALSPMIAKGFRAQLRAGNLLTGQLYVALDFFPKTPVAQMDWSRKPAVFPTVPGSFDGLQDSLVSIAEKLDRLPLDALAKDLSSTLKSVNQTVLHADAVVQQVGSEVTPEARKVLEDARKSLAALTRTLDTVEQSVGPEATLPTQAANTLAELGKAAKSLRTMADYLERHPETLLRGKPEDLK